MKNILKKFIKAILPPVLLDVLRFFLKYFVVIKNWKLIQRNKVLKNKYAGETVYIFGNGPSLNNYDLKLIAPCNVITMNHFELHPMKKEFNIVAHCIGEPYNSSTWEDPSPMLDGVKADTYWFNIDARKYFSGREIKNIYFYLQNPSGACFVSKRNDLGSAALPYQSTSQMAISVAMYMGFKKIFLIGFDHDWLVTRGHSPHFYEEQEGIAPADLSGFAYTEMIKISLNLFNIYLIVKKVADKHGIKIYNISDPTYLDVFPIIKNHFPEKASLSRRQ
jgi:hypothetical protein